MGHCVLIQCSRSGYNLISFPASFGFYYAQLRCGWGEETLGEKHFLEVCGNHPLHLISPRLALGLMGRFQSDTNEPVVILGFATDEI